MVRAHRADAAAADGLVAISPPSACWDIVACHTLCLQNPNRLTLSWPVQWTLARFDAGKRLVYSPT